MDPKNLEQQTSSEELSSRRSRRQTLEDKKPSASIPLNEIVEQAMMSASGPKRASLDIKSQTDKISFDICAELIAQELSIMFKETINRNNR